MTNSYISVVVPAYNEQDFLPACLDALSKQTVPPDVVYVVNNNSTDETVTIAQKYSFVKLLHEPVQGICAATKTGLDAAAARGGIILRCDADCRPEPDWIERTIESFVDTAVCGVTGPGIAYDCSRVKQKIIHYTYMRPYFFFVGKALGQPPLFGSNCAIRANVWNVASSHTHLASHQNIHDDIDISFHITTLGRIAYVDTTVMPISARPFRSFRGMMRRFSIGFRSIFIHWPEQAPWQKYIAKQRRN